MTLPARMLLPEHAASSYPVRDNVRAARRARRRHRRTVPVPHLGVLPRRRSPRDYAPPVPRPLRAGCRCCRSSRRVLTRPNLLLELLLIRVGYAAYRRSGSPRRRHAPAAGPPPRRTADQILAIEQFLHIDIEHWVNHAVVKIAWLRDFFDFYYTSFHFVVR